MFPYLIYLFNLYIYLWVLPIYLFKYIYIYYLFLFLILVFIPKYALTKLTRISKLQTTVCINVDVSIYYMGDKTKDQQIRKMIGEEEFKSQLYDIYETGDLQNMPNCKYVEFINKEHSNTNKSPSQVLKCQFTISRKITLDKSHISETEYDKNKVSAGQNIVIEILIRYETIFKEPQLCFRLWDQIEENSSDSVRLNYRSIDRLKEDSTFPSWFILNIDLVENEPWFTVGVCDTENIIGNRLLEDYKNRYMERWISVYLTSWLKPHQ